MQYSFCGLKQLKNTNQERPNAPRKLRWFRISLRSTLLLFLLIGGFSGWLGRELSMINNEALALAKLPGPAYEQEVYYDFENTDEVFNTGTPSDQFKPPTPRWMQAVLGERIFTRVDVLFFNLSAENKSIDLTPLTRLRSLGVTGIPSSEFAGPTQCWNDELGCRPAPKFSQLSIPPSVQHLHLENFNINGIDKLTSLQSLTVLFCRIDEVNIQDLQFLPAASTLKMLSFGQSGGVSSLRGIERVENVEDLSLFGSFKRLDELQHLKKLVKLDISYSNNIVDLKGFENFTRLTTLTLDGCSSLNNIEAILALPNLKEVSLAGCNEIPQAQIDKLKLIATKVTLDQQGVRF